MPTSLKVGGYSASRLMPMAVQYDSRLAGLLVVSLNDMELIMRILTPQ
jgi:hypothetical protein